MRLSESGRHFCINLDRRPDRRLDAENLFARENIDVKFFSAVDGEVVRNRRNQGTRFQYACQLSHRLILRQALYNLWEDVVIFEDDVMLPCGFLDLLGAIEVPEDWGVVLFGCTHVKMPEVVKRSVVQTKYFWGTHAYKVKFKYYRSILREMRKTGAGPSPDNSISRLANSIPIYALNPNCAWQRPGYSDLDGSSKQVFSEAGQQLRFDNISQKLDETALKP